MNRHQRRTFEKLATPWTAEGGHSDFTWKRLMKKYGIDARHRGEPGGVARFLMQVREALASNPYLVQILDDQVERFPFGRSSIGLLHACVNLLKLHDERAISVLLPVDLDNEEGGKRAMFEVSVDFTGNEELDGTLEVFAGDRAAHVEEAEVAQ